MKRVAYSICLFALLTSCQSQQPAETTEASTTMQKSLSPEAAFRSYLQNGFQQEIPDAEHWFVVLPTLGCKGCNIKELRELSQGPQRPNVTVLTAHVLRNLTGAERNRLASVTRLIADTILASPTKLDQLPLPFPAYTGLVRTEKGQVQEFIPFDQYNYAATFTRLPQRSE